MLRGALVIVSLATMMFAVVPTASADSLSGCVAVITRAVQDLEPGGAGYNMDGCSVRDPGGCICELTCDVDPNNELDRVWGAVAMISDLIHGVDPSP